MGIELWEVKVCERRFRAQLALGSVMLQGLDWRGYRRGGHQYKYLNLARPRAQLPSYPRWTETHP